MQFSINDIDPKQLEYLGIKKKDILNLPPREYTALFAGRRTGLFHFKHMTLPGLEELDAKLSIKKKEDGTPTLYVHPIRSIAKNSFDLSQEQMDKLSTEDGTHWVDKKLTNEEGQEEDYLVTLDKETNEYVALQKKTIKAPDEINGQKLNDDQKKNFVEGNNVDVNGEQFQLSPNEIGIEGADGNTFFKSVKFDNVKYNREELAFDLAIMLSGAAPWLLIGKGVIPLVKGFIKHATDKKNMPGRNRQNNYSEAELRTAAEIAKPQIEKTLKSDKANLKEEDLDNEWGAKGTLVDYGKTNYKFKENNEKSFFLKLENEQGQSREIWGTDLSRALDESNAKKSDQIGIKYLGSKPVRTKAKERDANGNPTGKYETIETKRNTFQVQTLNVSRKQSTEENQSIQKKAGVRR